MRGWFRKICPGRSYHAKLLPLVKFESILARTYPDFICSFKHAFEANALFTGVTMGMIMTTLGAPTNCAQSFDIVLCEAGLVAINP